MDLVVDIADIVDTAEFSGLAVLLALVCCSYHFRRDIQKQLRVGL